MALKTKINELCKAVGIKSAYELAKRMGYDHRKKVQDAGVLKMPTVYRAFDDDIKQFTPETLEALCKALECTPNDIFGYTTPQKSGKASETPRPAKTPGASNTAAQMEGMLTTQQVADRLGVRRRTVNDYILSGALPAIKIEGRGGQNYVSESEVEEFERSRKADS